VEVRPRRTRDLQCQDSRPDPETRNLTPKQVRNVTKEIPIERAYDFSFAKKADGELTQAGWKP
jgi:hypothetical protein